MITYMTLFLGGENKVTLTYVQILCLLVKILVSIYSLNLLSVMYTSDLSIIFFNDFSIFSFLCVHSFFLSTINYLSF